MTAMLNGRPEHPSAADPDSHLYELSLVIPAYNEAGRIAATLAEVMLYCRAQPWPVEVIVVDDGSHDATPDHVRAAEAGLPAPHQLRLVRHRRNRGKGAAVRTGGRIARGRYIFFSDADLAVPLVEIDRLLALLRDRYDVVVGVRVQPDGTDMRRTQPLLRRLAGRLFTGVRQFVAVPDVVDTQCPMKGFRREAAAWVFGRQRLTGWVFDTEILYLARRAGCRIGQQPVVWRHVGGSKLRLRPKLAFDVAWDLARLRLLHLREPKPSRPAPAGAAVERED